MLLDLSRAKPTLVLQYLFETPQFKEAHITFDLETSHSSSTNKTASLVSHVHLINKSSNADISQCPKHRVYFVHKCPKLVMEATCLFLSLRMLIFCLTIWFVGRPLVIAMSPSPSPLFLLVLLIQKLDMCCDPLLFLNIF